MILGVIADDFTGATDVASMLVRAGMRTVQVIGIPDMAPKPQLVALGAPLKGDVAVLLLVRIRPAPDADAVVVALKVAHHAGRAGGARIAGRFALASGGRASASRGNPTTGRSFRRRPST